MTPDKVVLEITAEGFCTTVFSGETVLSKRSHKMLGPGHSKSDKKGDIFDDFPLDFIEFYESFLDEVDDLSGDAFTVADELYRIKMEDEQ